ncbi:MAG: M3 family oligoendopeptidase [Anaerolineae bacterium]|nr:M3 family oligoendopeptidase [Anaerolineae bacterium]MDQ7037175.1 M3 family oligoendopeptidase [Anaerolineae bacterium]
MHDNFPSDYTVCLDWQWADWQAHYQRLIETDLNADTIVTWLKAWDIVVRMNSEVRWRLELQADLDTTNEIAEKTFTNFIESIVPEVDKATFILNKKLVASGLAPAALKIPMRLIEAQIKLFNEENLPILTQLSDADMRYRKLRGSQTVAWDGEEITLNRLRAVFEEPDRERREKAWHLLQECISQDREKIDEIWRDMMQLRKQIYQNAGLETYRDYRWLELGRFDYSPEDALSFVEAIEKTIVPVAKRLREDALSELGYDSLRPWDLGLFSHEIVFDLKGRPPLKPYDKMGDFIATSETIFNQVDTELGSFFRTMKEEKLLDLDNRKGKAPGGYCTMFPYSKRPFIFMNAVETAGDVTTLLHEAGHAFHVFSMSRQEYIWQWDFDMIPIEFAEVGSMAMELLATPYLTKDKGGYFTPEEVVRYRSDHLKGIVFALPYMAVVVAFQHWIYTNHDMATDATKCDEKWVELWNRFIPGVDWSGYEEKMCNRWRLQGHIYGSPFYYIEYALAQLGAVQVWANSLDDEKSAIAAYKQALNLGGTATLPQLFEAAGAKLAFDTETLQKVVDLINRTLAELES